MIKEIKNINPKYLKDEKESWRRENTCSNHRPSQVGSFPLEQAIFDERCLLLGDLWLVEQGAPLFWICLAGHRSRSSVDAHTFSPWKTLDCQTYLVRAWRLAEQHERCEQKDRNFQKVFGEPNARLLKVLDAYACTLWEKRRSKRNQCYGAVAKHENQRTGRRL